MLLFINWLTEKHNRLWNEDNGHLRSKGCFPLPEISSVLHAGKQQLQAEHGRSKSNRCYPLHLPRNKDNTLFIGDFWFCFFVMFSKPSFHYSLLCFSESFSLLLPLPFLSSASIFFPFKFLQFMYLESFAWDFSVPLSSQSLPSSTRQAMIHIHTFLVLPGFAHFSHLWPPSNPSSARLLSMSFYYCMPLHPPFDCHYTFHLASSPHLSFVIPIMSEKSTASQKIWVVCLTFGA